MPHVLPTMRTHPSWVKGILLEVRGAGASSSAPQSPAPGAPSAQTHSQQTGVPGVRGSLPRAGQRPVLSSNVQGAEHPEPSLHAPTCHAQRFPLPFPEEGGRLLRPTPRWLVGGRRRRETGHCGQHQTGAPRSASGNGQTHTLQPDPCARGSRGPILCCPRPAQSSSAFLDTQAGVFQARGSHLSVGPFQLVLKPN